MHARIIGGVTLLLGCCSANLCAQDLSWKASEASPGPAAPIVKLEKPQSLANPEPPASTAGFEVVRRAQAGDVPPAAPPYPGAVPPGANPYDGGVVNSDRDLGGFWSRLWNNVKPTGSAFQGANLFKSDSEFTYFASPVTNPFYFEDPRALTEARPVFIWQHTPSTNPVWNGGNNFSLTVNGSVAITENISFVINRLGFFWIDPRTGAPDISPHGGFSELLLGPKITFLRSTTSRTVAAAGLNLDLPVGSANNLQDTGHLMLIPYFSIAQNFGRSDYGSFNFMNTTGYNFRTDNTRTESFFSSFHLDYDIANLNRFYPLIELNWRYYTRNGGANDLNFEGGDLMNLGSQHVAGLSDVNLAFGTRIKINQYVQWGLGLEFDVLNNTGGRHLDRFRLTTDFIFRY